MPATTPGEAIATRLRANAGVDALVADRIYPTKPKQDTPWPYVVYFKVGGGDGVHLAGVNLTYNFTMRVEAYAETATAAEVVIKAVKTALHGWKDLTENVRGCFASGDADEQIAQDDGSQVSGQSFSLWFQG